MRVFRVFSFFGCALLFIAFSQGASAQCIVQVMAYCSNEQFSNPCSEPCNVNGEACGHSVDGDSNLVYSDTDGAQFGLSDVAYYSYPRYCGKVKICLCSIDPLGASCTPGSEDYSDYWVSESYAEGPLCLWP
jgi:hypothetical protein